MMPTIGEAIIGMTIFSRTLVQWTVDEAAIAAPPSPPISACDDDDGRPYHQVSRFQPMAPTRAAAQIARPVEPLGASMTPEPIVLATLVPKNAPNRFATAAIARATRGVRARVETDVAIACGGAAVEPGDVIVGDGDGVIVIPPHLVAEVAAEAAEQDAADAWVAERVAEGEPVDGLFPMNAEWRARYDAALREPQGAQGAPQGAQEER